MYLAEEGNQVDQIGIVSHPMLHLDDDNFVLDILDICMDSPYKDSKRFYTNSDFDELDIESVEVQYQIDTYML